MSRPKKLLLLRIATLAISLALFAGLAEVALRLASGGKRFNPYVPLTTRTFIASDEATPGVVGPSRFTTNSLGCRGPELAGEKVKLLTIGGSTTACTQLDDDETWPALIMRRVNEAAGDPKRLWVNNAAIDGRNLCHHLAFGKLLLPRMPKLDIVLVHCGFNDLSAWLFDERPFDPHALEDPRAWNDVVARAFRDTDVIESGEVWYRRSVLWRRLAQLGSRSQAGIARGLGGGIVQDDRGKWIVEMRARRKGLPKLPPPPERLAELPVVLDTFGRHLTELAADVRAAGAEPVFMAQAIRWSRGTPAERDSLWMGLMSDGKSYVREEDFERLLAAFNARMREVAAATGALFIDLPPALEGVEGIYYDGTHFNEKGAREVARVVADAIAPLVEARAKGR